MSRPVRSLALALVVLVSVASCGDEASDAAPEETVTIDDTVGTEETTDDAEDDSTTTSTVVDATAEEPPAASGGQDEGLGDPVVFTADLVGDTEIPGPGSPKAAGRVEIESDVNGDLCFDMVVDDLDAVVVGAHIHQAPAGASGEVVIPIGDPTSTSDGAATWSDVCIDVDDALVQQMSQDPSAFYANVHTETYGDGAVRGQLQSATIFDLTLS